MYLDEYKRWLAADLEDADLKPELAKVEGNDDEIKDRFAVALKFGTAGLRGVLGAGTNRMNEGFKLNRYAQDIGMLAKNAQGDYAVGVSEAQDALNSKNGLMNLGKIVSALGAAASMYGGVASAGLGAAGSAAAGAGTAGATAGTAAGSSGLTSSLLAAAPAASSKVFNLADSNDGGLFRLPYLNGDLSANPWSFAK